MNKAKINKLIAWLLDNYFVFAPVKAGEQIKVQKIEKAEQIDWSGQIPHNTFKPLFLPVREDLLTYENGNVKEAFNTKGKIIIWGMNLLDLEAFGLYELVFEQDFYYQKRRRNLIIVGYSAGIESDYRQYRIFHDKYKENILEHRSFDLFIEQQKNGQFKLFSGSEKGQQLLEDNKIKNYQHIEFAGFVPEEGPSKTFFDLQKRVKEGFDKKVWDELNEKCITCGRCTMACPTCFCFDTLDISEKDKIRKTRQWSSCFFNDFTTIAGGHEHLETVKRKIYFWYYHKFVRIPEQFSYTGCVSCMRCWKACPVDINIKRVLDKLK